MIRPFLIWLCLWLFGLSLLLAIFAVPASLVIGGVLVAWHYGGWLAAIVVFFLLNPIANILAKALTARWRTYKLRVNLHSGTEIYSEDPDKW